MASFTALAAGAWTDPNIWFNPLVIPPTPSGPPGAGDIAQIQVSGVFTGNAAVQTVMITDASVTFTGVIAASSDIDITNLTTATPMVLAVSGGEISASHQLEIGSSTTVTTSGGGIIAGPTSGTIGIQDFGKIVVNSGSISGSLLDVTSTLDLESGAATVGTLAVGAALGSTGSLTIASAGSIVDTLGTIGLKNQGTGVATITGGRWDNQQLIIGHQGTADVTVSAGGAITAQGGGTFSSGQPAMMIGEGGSAQGTLTLDGAGALATVTGDVVVGLQGAGNLALTNGGKLTASGLLEAGGTIGGAGNFDINGGVLTVGGDAILGDIAPANMTVTGGSVSVGGTTTLGSQMVGVGTLTLSGATSLVQTGGLVVGGAGIGLATLGDQTEISTSSDVIVGAVQGGSKSSGSLTLMSGSSLSDGGNLTVGDAGTGTLAINGGTLSLSGSAFIVGNAAAGNGDVSIQNSTVGVLGTVTIGNAGEASVSVNTEGTLSATSITLGKVVGGNGSFALDGAGSSTKSGDITIGAAGVGALQVTNSAVLDTSGNAMIASKGGPVQQTATIDTKASWEVGGALEVGLGGSADLAVQGAGQVAAGQVVVGDLSGADGTIAVTGTAGGIGSALSFSSSLVIGNGGTGTLQVTDEASVGPDVAASGTVAIGALSGGAGVVSLSDPGSQLSAAVLAVGGDASTMGGTGKLVIDTGATVSVLSATIWNSGTVILAGGALLTDPIMVDGTIAGFGVVGGAVTNAGAVVASGGTLELTGGVDGPGTLELAGGSALRLDAALAAGPQIVFDSGGAETLILGVPGGGLANAITGLANGDRIEFGGGMTVTAVTMLNAFTADVSFTELGGASGNYDLTGLGFAGGAGNFTFGVDGTTGDSFIEAALCFCAGTRIATPDGEAPVERLAVGDKVLTLSGATRSIVWVGAGQVLATRGRRNAATPVIVRRGALADDVPCRDLRVTKGHSLFIDGVLIPVEELINHRSILWDDRAQEVSIYHVELETHDVLIADGAPAESYRDDGNRWLFRNANAGWHLPPQAPCAPVLNDGAVVDAVWQRLLERAGPRPGVPLTDDPDLHLLVDGQRVAGKAQAGAIYVFRLPRRPSSVRVISRSGSPDELGIARDPRLLGVALRRAVVWRGPQMRLIEAADPALVHGFHQFEEINGLRWTDGDALLSATLFDGIDGACDVELHVGCTTRYPLFAEEGSIVVSAAA